MKTAYEKLNSELSSFGTPARGQFNDRGTQFARYGQSFKERALARLLPPDSARLEDLAVEIGGIG